MYVPLYIHTYLMYGVLPYKSRSRWQLATPPCTGPLRPRFGGPHVIPSSFTVQPIIRHAVEISAPKSSPHFSSACVLQRLRWPCFFLSRFSFSSLQQHTPTKLSFCSDKSVYRRIEVPLRLVFPYAMSQNCLKERRKEQRKMEDGKAETGRQKARWSKHRNIEKKEKRKNRRTPAGYSSC